MDCKTGAEHLASLRDSRAVYIDGTRVADVTRPSETPSDRRPRSMIFRPGPTMWSG